MGTITKRVDSKGAKSFQAKVRKAGYPIMSKTFPDEGMARAWIQQTELGIYKGQTAPTLTGNTTTIGQLIERYLKEVTPHKKGADQEKFHFRALENSPLAKSTVSTLTPEAVRNWRDDCLTRSAPATVNRKLNMLHHVIEHARMEWGISGGTNPVSDVSRPKNGPSRDRRLSHDEEVALFEAAKETRGGYLADAITLAIETGMRQSEIVGLLWENIDLKRRTARLLDTKNGEGRACP